MASRLSLCSVARSAVAALGAAWLLAPPTGAQEPPNGPAAVSLADGHVSLTYDGQPIFEGILSGGPGIERSALVDTVAGAVTQIIKWTARGDESLTLTGAVSVSMEGFPCEVEAREDGLILIRHSVGLSRSRLNRAVYDRHSDWVLSVDFPAGVMLTPIDSSDTGITVEVEATGQEIALRFRPRFYGIHRGLTAFRPWEYRPWTASVAGWTSWFAFRDAVTERDIQRATETVARTLAPYGYDYIQIDDGFQQQPAGLPDTWLVANDKFPSGLGGLRRSIADHGLTGGIWTYVSFHQREFAESHPEYFVRTSNGEPAYGNWVGWILDGSNPATLEDIVRPIYRGLRAQGWEYFKVDALRHLRYEGYNSHADWFRERGLDRTAVYRDVVRAIRDEIGEESFMLGSWGIRPELAGLLDACRVGDDGFGYGGFAQYNSFNNVVWRNDPDHVELTPREAYRATTATSLTGSLLMLTDRPEVYETPLVEAARRTAPVLFTVPGQIYDVDATRSRLIDRAATEVSGAGPRPLDAEQAARHHLYLLEVNRPFDNWMVLGRTGGEDRSVPFAQLGLEPDADYHVFEFWSARYLGVQRGDLALPPLDPGFNVQVLCLKAVSDRPQVVATGRHVSCGGWDLETVTWEGSVLRGRSRLVGGEQYRLYVTEPPGYRFVAASAEGADLLGVERERTLRVVTLWAHANASVRWEVEYVSR